MINFTESDFSFIKKASKKLNKPIDKLIVDAVKLYLEAFSFIDEDAYSTMKEIIEEEVGK